jgi:hypothetical protein
VSLRLGKDTPLHKTLSSFVRPYRSCRRALTDEIGVPSASYYFKSSDQGAQKLDTVLRCLRTLDWLNRDISESSNYEPFGFNLWLLIRSSRADYGISELSQGTQLLQRSRNSFATSAFLLNYRLEKRTLETWATGSTLSGPIIECSPNYSCHQNTGTLGAPGTLRAPRTPRTLRTCLARTGRHPSVSIRGPQNSQNSHNHPNRANSHNSKVKVLFSHIADRKPLPS